MPVLERATGPMDGQHVGDLAVAAPIWPWPVGEPSAEQEPLHEGGVHLWAIDVGPVRRSRRERAHSGLRELIAAYERREPRSVRISRSALGKPFVTGKLEFNLSHSGSLALIAFASEQPLGLDVELLERRRPLAEVTLARRLWGETCSRRLAAMGSDRRRRVFLELWVDHEARAKLSGQGLGGPVGQSTQACWTASLALGTQAIATLAMERAPSDLRCRRLLDRGALRSDHITHGYP